MVGLVGSFFCQNDLILVCRFFVVGMFFLGGNMRNGGILYEFGVYLRIQEPEKNSTRLSRTKGRQSFRDLLEQLASVNETQERATRLWGREMLMLI